MRGWIAIACALGGCQLDWDALIGDGDAAVDAGGIDAGADGGALPDAEAPDARTDSGLPRGEITQLSAGGHHTCAIVGGELACWGRNDRGQLGVGHRGAHDGAVIVPIVGVKQVSAGALHTCAIDEADELYCWGEPGGARLGTGDPAPRDAPASSILSNVRQVSAGVEHSCAVTLDGVVWCWGTEQAGETGARGEQPTPQPVTLPTAASPEEVAVGSDHSCVRTSDGLVWCWGEDELRGDGEMAATSTPAQARVDAATKIVSGFGHMCALLSDATVQCWGNGYSGEIGDGSMTEVRIPTRAMLTGVTDVAAGGHHTCASTGDGALHCWGRGITGALGVDVSIATTPRQVAGLAVAGPIAAGGAGLEDHTCAVAETGALSCWGYRAWGQLGDGYRVAYAEPTTVAGAVTSASAGGGHLCWSNGMRVDCLGKNDDTQSGHPVRAPVESPQAIAIPSVATSVGVGARHGCAITDGDGRLFCWGAGESGQLGHGDSPMRVATPVEVAGVTDGTAWVDVAAGARHTCGRRDDGSVHCWGDPAGGALGYAATGPGPFPSPNVAIASGATAIATGTQFTCAIVSNDVRCWGAGDRGQRGTGELTDSAVPEPVPLGRPAIALAAGLAHACAATVTGVYCWGEASDGRLGAVMDAPSPTPFFVPVTVPAVQALALGDGHSCALSGDGTVSCWGRNDYGQLGRGGFDAPSGPALVLGLEGAIDIVAYDHQTCARTATSLVCWGMAAEGRIVPAGGDPLFVSEPTAVTVLGG